MTGGLLCSYVILNPSHGQFKEEFDKGHWTITKGVHRYSSLPIDQAHEQANKWVKGAEGMIGLTEHPKMLERWAIYVPELSRILEDFESDNDDNDTNSDYLAHHEEEQSSQSRYHQHVSKLLDVILKAGNPFEETSNKLVSLDNKECEAEVAGESIGLVESKGQKQYNCYKRDVLQLQSVTLQMSIKKNNHKIFNQTKVPRKSNVMLRYRFQATRRFIREGICCSSEQRSELGRFFSLWVIPISTGTCNPWNNSFLHKIWLNGVPIRNITSCRLSCTHWLERNVFHRVMPGCWVAADIE